MKRLLIAVVFFVALTPVFGGDDDGLFTIGLMNGRSWSLLTPEAKAVFVRGVYEGLDLLATLPEDPKVDAIHQSVTDLAVTTRATFAEVAETIDVFYKEPLNRNVPVISALTWAKLKADGATAVQLDENSAKLRALYKAAK
jgi:hypothetical protein